MKNDFTYMGSKAYKECEVIPLSADNSASNLVKLSRTQGARKQGNFEFLDTSYIHGEDDFYIPFNLYIFSNEEIKEGDWCLNISKRIIYKKDKYPMDTCWKKIIATTDSSLKSYIPVLGRGEDSNFAHYPPLPRPSNEFLKAYCEQNGKIDKVLVEYEVLSDDDMLLYERNVEIEEDWFKLKISPDNTITIKRVVNKTYNQEEVIELLKRVLNLGMNLRQEQLSGYSVKSGNEVLEEWIKDNL